MGAIINIISKVRITTIVFVILSSYSSIALVLIKYYLYNNISNNYKEEYYLTSYMTMAT